MRSKIALLCASASLFLFAVSAWAHHSFSAEFDLKKPIHLRGTVTEVEWVNPHAWIHIDVKAADGQVNNWMIEAGTPNVLFRRGLNKNSVVVGSEIVVEGFQAKDSSFKGSGRDITLPDGRKLFIGSDGAGAPDEGKK